MTFQPHSDEALVVALTFTNRNGRASGETREYITHTYSNDMYVLGDVTAGFNDEDDGVPGSMASKLGIMVPGGNQGVTARLQRLRTGARRRLCAHRRGAAP